MANSSPSAGPGRVAGADLSGPSPVRNADRVLTTDQSADRSAAASSPGRTIRSWPLLVLAAPAAAEVWSGWAGIAQKTGFGLVRPLPGIWPALHLDTAITLPVGVEAYAAYALRAWLASDRPISSRTRRFAKWSAIFSFALGMAGQAAYHLLAQAKMATAPWAITIIVSCLPVLVLGMGTALAHMLRADASASTTPDRQPEAPPAARSTQDQVPFSADQGPDRTAKVLPRPMAGATTARHRNPGGVAPARTPDSQATEPRLDRARLIASSLIAAGRPVTRRTLRGSGVKGSNEFLNALARKINAEKARSEPAASP